MLGFQKFNKSSSIREMGGGQTVHLELSSYLSSEGFILPAKRPHKRRLNKLSSWVYFGLRAGVLSCGGVWRLVMFCFSVAYSSETSSDLEVSHPAKR